MMRVQLWIVGSVAVLLVAGSAVAGLGSARWHTYKSDLVRCEDTVSHGINACGSFSIGVDPLQRGSVIVNGKSIVVQVSRTEVEEFYFVDFVPLRNTGEDPDGAYLAEDRIYVGGILTNKAGNGTLRTQNPGIVGPQLGYFVLSKFSGGDGGAGDDGLVLSAMDEAAIADFRAATAESERREFVSGFDPDFARGPAIPLN